MNPQGGDRESIVRADARRRIDVAHQPPSEPFFNSLLGDWGARWAFGDPRPNELDPIVLLWWMRRRVCLDRLLRRRVLQFDFQGLPRSYWLFLDRSEASVCLQDPGFDIDLLVRADIA